MKNKIDFKKIKVLNNQMIRKKRKSNKYVFVLKNVNVEIVDQKYGITIVSNISQIQNQPDNTTKLSELDENTTDKSLEIISFLDESKRLYQCNVSMIDFKNGNEVNSNQYNCFWCRHKFSSYPIGCPINYVSSKTRKVYHSEVSKDTYTIKENITKTKSELIQNNLENIQNKVQDKNIPFVFSVMKDNKNCSFAIKKEEYFEVDGIFCSFNCCKAFIKDNKHNPLYEHSEMLLVKLFNDIMVNDKNKEENKISSIYINPAPSWRLLQEYGGHLTINEFRENFNKVTYDYHGIVKKELFKPLAHIYEEKINF